MNNITYQLSAPDNKSNFLDDQLHPEDLCSFCGFLKDPENYFNPFVRIRNKSYDLSYTYDNRPIVSLRFKEFCLRQNYKHLDFKDFEHEPNFFHLKVDQIVKVDFEKSVRSTDHFCEQCKTWGGVYLNELILDRPYSSLGDGIYKTDIRFSGGNQKSPILVIGNETFQKLKREKIKGIICLPINSK